MDENLKNYSFRHTISKTYLLATILNGAKIDQAMDSKNVSTAYNMKVPYLVNNGKI